MKFTGKITIFICVFSLIFYWMHVSGHYNTRVVLADLGGLPWLYSSLVTLFSIVAGFVIQKEWDNWNSLVDSVKGEADSLKELWLWAQYLPEEYKEKFKIGIRRYLEEMVNDGLNKSERGERSAAIEAAFETLQNAIFEMSKNDPALMTATFSFFTKLIEFRTSRIRHSFHHIPEALSKSLPFGTFLIIFLSLFIGIKNIWLDYVFTLSIALAAFVIYIIINDLDHPLTPGSWHLTTKDYEILLAQIKSAK